MLLQEILAEKGTHVYTISQRATLAAAVQELVDRNCGSLVVVEADGSLHGHMLGIITERDVLRATARFDGAFAELEIQDVMTCDAITGNPTDTVEDTMGLMTERRIRHLPIVEEGRLVGLISIGDVVKAQHHWLSMENYYLKSYIHG